MRQDIAQKVADMIGLDLNDFSWYTEPEGLEEFEPGLPMAISALLMDYIMPCKSIEEYLRDMASASRESYVLNQVKMKIKMHDSDYSDQELIWELDDMAAKRVKLVKEILNDIGNWYEGRD